jgi:hypothetical protein
MRSPVRVQVHDEITPKGDKDQSVTKEHPWGLKRKDQTSCKKTPYLGREDNVAKLTPHSDVKVHSDVGSARHFLSVKMMQL